MIPSRLDCAEIPVDFRAAVTVIPATPRSPTARTTIPTMISTTAKPLRRDFRICLRSMIRPSAQLLNCDTSEARPTDIQLAGEFAVREPHGESRRADTVREQLDRGWRDLHAVEHVFRRGPQRATEVDRSCRAIADAHLTGGGV